MISFLSKFFRKTTQIDVGCHVITQCYSRFSCVTLLRIIFQRNNSSRRKEKLLSNWLPSNLSHILLIMWIALLLHLPSSKANAIAFNSPSKFNSSLPPTTTTTTTTITTTKTQLLSTTIPVKVIGDLGNNMLNYLKGQKGISIPENKVVVSEDAEDYFEEDHTELDYRELLMKENASGIISFFIFYFTFNFSMPT
jgi:hypothetical protein